MKIIPAILTDSIRDFKKKLKQASEFSDMIHIDIMDGIFVPSKSVELGEVAEALISRPDIDTRIDIRSRYIRYLVHLMVQEPAKELDSILEIKPEYTIIHAEADGVIPVIRAIKNAGLKAGLALNPETKVEKIKELLTPHPALSHKGRGFGGDSSQGEGFGGDSSQGEGFGGDFLQGREKDKFSYSSEDLEKNFPKGASELNLETGLLDLVLILSVNPGFYGSQFIPETLGKISEIRQINDKIKVGIDGGVNLSTISTIAAAKPDYIMSGSFIFEKGETPREKYIELVKHLKK